jgi:hypothetical protein
MPSKSDVKSLEARTIERRAVEAVIWGMPIVNYELRYQALRRLKGDFNQIVYWSGLRDWRNQTLTPNPDSIYLMPFFNTKDVGPMVLEIPPADEGKITMLQSIGIEKGKPFKPDASAKRILERAAVEAHDQCSSASTGPRNRSSRRSGSCQTSKGCDESHEHRHQADADHTRHG